MPLDPKNIPLGVFSLEVAELLADAINHAGAPAGNAGDIQFNDGSGHFANADTVSPGDTANLQNGVFEVQASVQVAFGVGSAGLFADNTGAVTMQGTSVQITATETDVNSTSLQIASQDFANTNYVIAGDVRSGHEQNIQMLGANINVDFPATIIQADGSGNSISLNSPQIILNRGANPSCAIVLGNSSDSVKVGDTTGSVGFMGASPTTRATITGSKGGNVALANLLIELANKGLITDSTT